MWRGEDEREAGSALGVNWWDAQRGPGYLKRKHFPSSGGIAMARENSCAAACQACWLPQGQAAWNRPPVIS